MERLLLGRVTISPPLSCEEEGGESSSRRNHNELSVKSGRSRREGWSPRSYLLTGDEREVTKQTRERERDRLGGVRQGEVGMKLLISIACQPQHRRRGGEWQVQSLCSPRCLERVLDRSSSTALWCLPRDPSSHSPCLPRAFKPEAGSPCCRQTEKAWEWCGGAGGCSTEA
jgi:hypothetical protein